jgi:hypothetical protein
MEQVEVVAEVVLMVLLKEQLVLVEVFKDML